MLQIWVADCLGDLRAYKPRPRGPALYLDPDQQAAVVEGRLVPLAPREYELLAILYRSANCVVRRGAIIRQFWPQGSPGGNMLDVYMRRLRLKLQASGYTGQVRTIRGCGYVLEPPEGESAARATPTPRHLDY
jgi:DNA-binding response OmpR family regulator